MFPSLYLTNKKGYPVLPRSLQALVKRFVPLDVQVIVEGRNRGHNANFYQQYLNHLWQEHDTADPVKQYAKVRFFLFKKYIPVRLMEQLF